MGVTHYARYNATRKVVAPYSFSFIRTGMAAGYSPFADLSPWKLLQLIISDAQAHGVPVPDVITIPGHLPKCRTALFLPNRSFYKVRRCSYHRTVGTKYKITQLESAEAALRVMQKRLHRMARRSRAW